jgi:hypothetical protein
MHFILKKEGFSERVIHKNRQHFMADTNTISLGIIIALFFIWRFARTRKLYLYSLQVQTFGSEPILFDPHNLRIFFQQAVLGRRSVKPISFFIRASVFIVVEVCVLPFKDYEPLLYWLVVVLIAIYVPYCLVHGVMLKKRLPHIQEV